MLRFRTWTLITLASLLGVSSSTNALSIILNPGAEPTVLSAQVTAGGLAEDTLTPFTTPFIDSLFVTTSATNASDTDYSLDSSEFRMIYSHSRSTTAFVQSASEIYFAVTEDVGYTLSGRYQYDDPDGRSVVQRAFLFDVTSSATLFDGLQQSLSTPFEDFTVGEAEGGFDNTLVGSLSGTLTAGHEYKLIFNAFIDTTQTPATQDATAEGYFSLRFVPEPTIALLLAFELVGLDVLLRVLAGD